MVYPSDFNANVEKAMEEMLSDPKLVSDGDTEPPAMPSPDQDAYDALLRILEFFTVYPAADHGENLVVRCLRCPSRLFPMQGGSTAGRLVINMIAHAIEEHP